MTSHRTDHLTGPDTMVGHMTWDSGLQGTVSASNASDTFKYEFEITGLGGTVLLQRSTSQPGYNLSAATGLGKAMEATNKFFGFEGLENEFLAFAEACRGGSPDKNSPVEALSDIRLVEGLLESGKQGGETFKLRY